MANSSDHFDRRGFTLIEMLTVIAIILLLLTLMIPGGRRMMEAAMIPGCLNNQRQLTAAALLYGADHDGAVLREDDPSGARAPWRMYLVGAGAGGQDHYLRNIAMSWGVLYADQYVRNSRDYYCPKRDRDTTLTQNKHRMYWGAIGSGPVDWRTLVHPGSVKARRVTSGYMFNAYRIERLSTAHQPGRMNNYSMAYVPPYKQVLVFDMVRTVSQILYHQDDLLNMGLTDGSARSYSAKTLQARIESGVGSVDGNWALFDLLMDDVLRPAVY